MQSHTCSQFPPKIAPIPTRTSAVPGTSTAPSSPPPSGPPTSPSSGPTSGSLMSTNSNSARQLISDRQTITGCLTFQSWGFGGTRTRGSVRQWCRWDLGRGWRVVEWVGCGGGCVLRSAAADHHKEQQQHISHLTPHRLITHIDTKGWARFTTGPFKLVRLPGANHLWPCGGDAASKRAWLAHIVSRMAAVCGASCG